MKRILRKSEIGASTFDFVYYYDCKLFCFDDKTDSNNNINYKRKKSINRLIKFENFFLILLIYME